MHVEIVHRNPQDLGIEFDDFNRALFGHLIDGTTIDEALDRLGQEFSSDDVDVHRESIIEQCRPEAIHVVYCDAAVNRTDQFTCDDLPVKLTPCGGGGTDLRKIFEWVDGQGLRPDCAVVLTDMYTPFGEAPDYPVVWLSTSGVTEAPFGDVVPYSMEE